MESVVEKGGKGDLVRSAKIHFFDDKAAKPVGIYDHIGRRPILAFGNSDGDMQMIEYTTGAAGRRLGLFLHHTDGDREFACLRPQNLRRHAGQGPRPGGGQWLDYCGYEE